MTTFKSKKINQHKSLGEILKNARERHGLSLDVLAKQLDIKIDYLKKIESDNWQALPGEFYIKTYIKKYAQSLQLPGSTVQSILDQKMETYQKWHAKKNKHNQISKKHFVVMPKILNKTILFALIFILLIYLGYQVWQITSPPRLEILNPSQQTISYAGNTFVVNGQTEKNTRIKINSQEVFPDETGFFSLQINLSSGLNLIKIEARKRYSRSTIKEREIVVD